MCRHPRSAALDADGVGWITFDSPDSRANAFNAATQTALAAALCSDRPIVAIHLTRPNVKVPDRAALVVLDERGELEHIRLAYDIESAAAYILSLDRLP